MNRDKIYRIKHNNKRKQRSALIVQLREKEVGKGKEKALPKAKKESESCPS